jgi:uncharacterized MAPEG superfamily protein
MTTPLVCLMIVAFLPYLCAWTGAYYKVRQFGSLDNKTPREQTAKLQGTGARIAAAQDNAWEALPLFTAAVVASQLGHADPGRAAWLSELFVATRILHPIFYAKDQDKLRSLVFLIGLLCVVGLFVSAL